MRDKGKSIRFDKTEESIFTLLSLCILTVQAFESLCGEEDILNADFDATKPRFEELMNDTIHEALVYQILLKSCAYLDEWDKFLGVKTEDKDSKKILKVKKIVKPAYKRITSWTNLREFRNQAIAHNHRDKNGRNIYLNDSTWHSPQSTGEIYLLVYCIKSMTEIVNCHFPDVAKKFVLRGLKDPSGEVTHRFIEEREIRNIIKEINNEISENLNRERAFDGLSP
jgi:hypothetical protein